MKKLRRIIFRLLAIIGLLLLVIFFIYTGPSWWRHWVTYPRLEKSRSKLWSKYKQPPKFIKQEDFKGVLHVHSYWSHDSRGVIQEILPAAKKAKLDFIFFSDHPHAKLDTFPRSYSGVFDGIIFEPGTETSTGLMVCPMKKVILDWSLPQDSVIHSIVNSGGLVFYVHTEKPHDWANPDYQGMEIYNIHTDLLDEKSILPFVINFTINGSKYRHWAYRELYDDQIRILANWDSLNTNRRIVGISAVDAHNNQNIRARYLADGRVEWVGPNAKTLSIKKPGWKEKLLLGEPDAGSWAFKWEMDTYFGSFNYVNNHVFSDTLTNVAIRNALVKGHVFISFENLAEATGFQFFALDSANYLSAIMGDSVKAAQVQELSAVSPFPVQFKLIKNGKVIGFAENVYEYQFNPQMSPGIYRLVASLKLGKKWLPWVFTNPIYLY